EAVGQAEGVDQHIMARRLVVPGIPSPVVADLVDAAGEIDPARFIRLLRSGGRRARTPRTIGWPQRIGGEERENVGEQELLVLLLVVDADLDEPRDLRRVGTILPEERG